MSQATTLILFTMAALCLFLKETECMPIGATEEPHDSTVESISTATVPLLNISTNNNSTSMVKQDANSLATGGGHIPKGSLKETYYNPNSNDSDNNSGNQKGASGSSGSGSSGSGSSGSGATEEEAAGAEGAEIAGLLLVAK